MNDQQKVLIGFSVAYGVFLWRMDKRSKESTAQASAQMAATRDPDMMMRAEDRAERALKLQEKALDHQIGMDLARQGMAELNRKAVTLEVTQKMG